MKLLPAMSAVLAAALLSTGCKSPDAVVFVTTTGVNVEASTASGTESTAHVGYTRFEGVIMPGRGPDGTPRKKAYPVLSKMDFSSGSLFLPAFSITNTGSTAPMRLNQVFATGKAATGPKSVESVNRDFNVLSGQLALHRNGQAAARKFIAEADAEKLKAAWDMALKTGLISGNAPARPAETAILRSALEDAMVGNDEITRTKLDLFMKQMKLK